MVDLRANWENRAICFGDELAGVLFRGLSVSANEAIHDWHSWVVREAFSTSLPTGAKVLDLGCGYGRLSKILATARRDVSITGADIALGYCRMYREAGGVCVCSDMTHLPFANGNFDAVMAVTSLMYAATSADEILGEIFRIMKPGGALLLLDPGIEMQRLIASLRGSKAESPTGGEGFGRSQYLGMIKAAGFHVRLKGGNQALSHALFIPGMRKARNRWAAQGLKWMAKRDCTAAGYSISSLHRWVLAVRGERSA